MSDNEDSEQTGVARIVKGKTTFEMTEEAKEGERDRLQYDLGRYSGQNEANPWKTVDAFFANEAAFDPPAKRIIPKRGAWVMIVKPLPPMEGRVHEKVTVCCVFYAKHVEGTDSRGFDRTGYYKVELHTPWGRPCVWPFEYAPIDNESLARLVQIGELTFHPFEMGTREFNERLYYIMSRGIPVEAAMALVAGTMKAPVGWFEPRADIKTKLAEMFGE